MDDLEKFLDCPGGKQIDSFVLCGDYGDPIYYPELLAFIRKFRSTKTFNITTNGSYKSREFWMELASLLTEKDSIIFSIDGLEDTNHIYRINSDWNSTMVGLDIMVASKTPVTWKTIVFDYNYTQLDDIAAFAESRGAKFEAHRTHRFDNCEDLRPPAEFVETHHEYGVNFITDHILVDPQCHNEKVITCDGIFHPCEFIRNPKTFYKSQLWKQRAQWIEKLHISDITYDQGMQLIHEWEEFVRSNSVNNTSMVDVICKMKCRQGCRKTPIYKVGTNG